ncbi:hypothetical protein D3C72_1718030 [compost metagenome]
MISLGFAWHFEGRPRPSDRMGRGKSPSLRNSGPGRNAAIAAGPPRFGTAGSAGSGVGVTWGPVPEAENCAQKRECRLSRK